MRNIKFHTALALLSSFLIFAGCDRPSSNESRVNVSLPSKLIQSKLGNVSKQGQLGHLVINISGPGMAVPFVFNWDVDNQNPNCSGESCTLVVPAGDNRLIQVLAVYMATDPVTGAEQMEFQYGDQTKALIAGDNSVSISLASITSGAVTEAEFGGRYLETATDGPTGKLNISYVPTGKPAVLIMQTEMFGGWFQAMAFKGLPLQYSLNGKVILSGDTTSMFDAKLGQALMQIKWPQYYEEKDSSPSLRPASDQYLGFFGPAVNATHKVCYPSFTGDVARAFSGAAVTNSDPKIQWNGNTVDSTRGYVVAGGQAYASDTAAQAAGCADSNNEPRLIGFAINPIDRGIPRMSAPFMKGNELDTSVVNQVNWKFLPGAGVSVVGFRLYGLPSAAMDEYRSKMSGDGYRCAELERDLGTKGIFKIADAGPLQRSISFSSSVNPSPKVLCVKTAFGWANSAARAWGGSSMANLEVNDFNFELRSKIGTNQCHPFRVRLFYNGMTGGANIQNTQIRTFNFTGTNLGANYKFYSSGDCTGGEITTTGIASGNFEVSGSFKALSITNENVTINEPILAKSYTRYIDAIASPSTATSFEVVDTEMNMKLPIDGRRMINFLKLDSSGYTTTVGSIVLNFDRFDAWGSAVTDFAINTDCNSITLFASALAANLSTKTINPGDFGTSVCVRVNAIGNTVNRKLVINSMKSIYINVQPLADHLKLEILSPAPYYQGECLPIKVTARDTNDVIMTTTNFQITDSHIHNGNHGTFYSQPDCSGSLIFPQSLSSGVLNYYYRVGSVSMPSANPVNLEASSPFVNQNAYVTTSYNAYPSQFLRGTNKLVLFSDQAPRMTTLDNITPATSWYSHDLDGMGGSAKGTPAGYSGGVSTGAMPASTGVSFSAGSYLNYDFTSSSSSEEFLVTMVFTVTNLSSEQVLFSLYSTSSILITKVAVDTNGSVKVWNGSSWSSSAGGLVATMQPYRLTLKRTVGPSDLEVRLNEAMVTGYTNWTFPVTDLQHIHIGETGSNFNGYVKALILDSGSGASSINYQSDTDHVTAR